MDPAGNVCIFPFDAEPFLKETSKNIKVFNANYKRLLHYLIELDLSEQSELEKLVSCYVFHICHKLLNRFNAFREPIRTVWMHVFLLNDEIIIDAVKRLKGELK